MDESWLLKTDFKKDCLVPYRYFVRKRLKFGRKSSTRKQYVSSQNADLNLWNVLTQIFRQKLKKSSENDSLSYYSKRKSFIFTVCFRIQLNLVIETEKISIIDNKLVDNNNNSS